jgi:long-chain acyl-CoA synthetase
MASAAILLSEAARSHETKTAIIDPDDSITYGGLDARARSIAQGLANAGLSPGDHVAIVAPPSRHFVAAYFGILYARMVAVPLNTRLRSHQIRAAIDHAEANAVLVAGSCQLPDLESAAVEGALAANVCGQVWLHSVSAEPLQDGVAPWDALEQSTDSFVDLSQVPDSDTACLSFTSGTVGDPRAAIITHESDLSCARPFATCWGLRTEDVLVSSIGLFTGYGRVALLNPGLVAGATFAFLPAFSPSAMIETMARCRATAMHGVPAMYYSLKQVHESGQTDLKTLTDHWTHLFYGGAPMRRDLRHFFGVELGVKTVQGYGLTECNAIGMSPADCRPSPERYDPVTPLYPDHFQILDDDGAPVRGDEVGEVVAKGPSVMRGYYKNEALTVETSYGGWFHTGDYGRWVGEDRYALVGRRCDTINRGGYMVHPNEIESVLLDHPEIDGAAVKGIPDDRLGEEIAAYVVLQADTVLTEDAILEWARARLASFQYPRYVVVMDALPMGPTGKVQKPLLPTPGTKT